VVGGAGWRSDPPLAVALAWVQPFLAFGVLLPPAPALTCPLPTFGRDKGPLLEQCPSPGAMPPRLALSPLGQTSPTVCSISLPGMPTLMLEAGQGHSVGAERSPWNGPLSSFSQPSSPASGRPKHQSVWVLPFRKGQLQCVLTIGPSPAFGRDSADDFRELFLPSPSHEFAGSKGLPGVIRLYARACRVALSLP
jgi:hypothetical protein